MSQNLLSFNISTKCTKTDQKINAITKEKHDIIFICDIRLNSLQQNYSIHDLTKKLNFKGYDFFQNSKRSSRGVGILIKKKLSYTINNQLCDQDDNYLLLDITILNYRMIIGSIYGPNTNNTEFFENLNADLLNLNCDSVILGGDWNATWDKTNGPNNIDIINMVNIPSKIRSENLNRLARNNNLTEPYRTLNPDLIDFTFIPNIRENINRSRLDFFLISESLIGKCKNSSISSSLISKLFDHKAVSVNFRKNFKRQKDKIKDTILKCPELTHLIYASAIDCYISHSVTTVLFNATHKIEMQQKLGEIFLKLSELQKFELSSITEGSDHLPEFSNLLAAKHEIINNLISNLPNLEFFQSLTLSCRNDTFFEVLSMKIKAAALSFQSFYYKKFNMKKDQLKCKIRDLKTNYNRNQNEIRLQEGILANIEEQELREELALLKNFERLNNEKITPYFLDLAKKPGHNESLEKITNEDGTAFNCTKERGIYITNFYSKLYQKPVNENPNNLTIDEFLGDISNHPEVRNSKLSEQEKLELDRPFTIEELDLSNKKSKKNSSPGIDGISNRFIDKFWYLFRVPLYNYTMECYEKESLTDNFRNVKIRLIPKKGDLTHIKNWRPISLLNCFYKIISRAITFRIRKYIDKITNVGQHGYSSNKQCQEVLISIIDEIQKAKHENKSGALLSLDIQKAFDSISHDYLLQSYKFFNFGDNIIKWLKLIGTNRKACIIMEDESLSPFFNLDRGNAQGDNISPYSFNIGYQILLFKLNFDLQIARLNDPPDVPGEPAAQGSLGRKVFAFADDGNCITKLEVGSLVRIFNLLEIFGSLSGLICNVEKTALVLIGANVPVEPEIQAIGFNICRSLTVLGLKINGENLDFGETFEKICEKIRNIIKNWARFNLSLPGRINIAKCFLYSQINYLGCFLEVPNVYMSRIRTLIENFVLGNLRVSKKRLYARPEDGGLGLFDFEDFLDSQRCQWIKRARTGNELWKRKLRSGCMGDLSSAKSKFFKVESEPVLFGIVKSFERFSDSYTKYKENFWLSTIFENRALPISFRLNNPLSEEELDPHTYANFGRQIKSLTISDFYPPLRTRMKTRVQVRNDSGILFTPEDFEKLKKICNNAKQKYLKTKIDDKKSMGLSRFLDLRTKGSRIFRKIIKIVRADTIPHNIVKFAETTETFINLEDSKLLNKCWNVNYLSNSTRTFLFKFYNNIAGYNAAVSHFVRGHSSNCTFCTLNFNPEPNRENALHLFYNCDCTSEILDGFFSHVIGENVHVSRYELFVQFKRFSKQKNEVLFIISKLYLKAIWDCKVRQYLPTLDLPK